MPLPSKSTLVREGVYNVLASNDTIPEHDLPRVVTNWLTVPDVRAAAEKDAEHHLAWGRCHDNSLDNCELPHNNLFRVFSKYL